MRRLFSVILCLAWMAGGIGPGAASASQIETGPLVREGQRWGLPEEAGLAEQNPAHAASLRPAEPTAEIPVHYDPAIANLISLVTPQKLSNLVGGLSGEWPVTIGGSPYTLTTRNSLSGEPILKATQYAWEYFSALGLATEYHTFDLSGYAARNVIAEQRGLVQPEQVVLLTAHLDDMPGLGRAPGADDNASGSAAVLLAAEVLSTLPFGCTLRYALFTGEEQGLIGSWAYAEDLASQGENLAGVINLDMIGYNGDTFPVMDLYTSVEVAGSLEIAEAFSQTVGLYGLNLQPNILEGSMKNSSYLGNFSDNRPFWWHDFPAILVIEDTTNDFNPNYHTDDDLLSNLDLAYYMEITRAAVATLAQMGCLMAEPAVLSGAVMEAGSGEPVSGALVEASPRPGLVFSATTSATGLYQAPVISETYTVTASASGYAPFTAAGIAVTAGLTTTLDVELCELLAGPSFTLEPALPRPGEPVTFTARLDAGSGTATFQWDFGDGSTSAGATAVHTFAGDSSAGRVYPVTLNARNACSGPVVVTRELVIGGPYIYVPLFLQQTGF